MGFDASAVESMSYDFSTWWHEGMPEGAQQAGPIPEPSVDQIERFNEFWLEQLPVEFRAHAADLQDRISALRAADNREVGELEAVMSEMVRLRKETAMGAMLPAQTAAVCELCSQQPPVEVVSALPARVQVAFRDYVMGEIVDGPKEKSGSSG